MALEKGANMNLIILVLATMVFTNGAHGDVDVFEQQWGDSKSACVSVKSLRKEVTTVIIYINYIDDGNVEKKITNVVHPVFNVKVMGDCAPVTMERLSLIQVLWLTEVK